MRNKYALTFIGHFEIWPEDKVRSFTNEVVGYGHAAYQTTRLDQASRLVPLTSLKTIMSRSIDKKRFMTSHNLRWPFPVPLSISGTRIITDEIGNLLYYWNNWVVLTRLHEAGGISIFSHRLAMQMSSDWPDLRSQIYKFWDIKIAHTGTLTKTWREEIDQSKALALACLQTFRSTNRLWWPDLT